MILLSQDQTKAEHKNHGRSSKLVLTLGPHISTTAVWCLTYNPLPFVLSPDGLAAFRTFLKSEFSDENIEFWMACEEYKKTKSSTKLFSKANKIYKEFIDTKAPREVCMPVCVCVFPCKTVCYPGRWILIIEPEKKPSEAWRIRPQPASMKSKQKSTAWWRETRTHDSFDPRCTRIWSAGHMHKASADLSEPIPRRALHCWLPGAICLNTVNMQRWTGFLVLVPVGNCCHMQTLQKRCVDVSRKTLTYIQWWLNWIQLLTDLKIFTFVCLQTPHHFEMLLRMVAQSTTNMRGNESTDQIHFEID